MKGLSISRSKRGLELPRGWIVLGAAALSWLVLVSMVAGAIELFMFIFRTVSLS